MATDKPEGYDVGVELTAEDHPRIKTDTSGESSSSSKRNRDLEIGRILSPVVGAVTAVASPFIPKIQKVPWYHFFVLLL